MSIENTQAPSQDLLIPGIADWSGFQEEKSQDDDGDETPPTAILGGTRSSSAPPTVNPNWGSSERGSSTDPSSDGGGLTASKSPTRKRKLADLEPPSQPLQHTTTAALWPEGSAGEYAPFASNISHHAHQGQCVEMASKTSECDAGGSESQNLAGSSASTTVQPPPLPLNLQPLLRLNDVFCSPSPRHTTSQPYPEAIIGAAAPDKRRKVANRKLIIHDDPTYQCRQRETPPSPTLSTMKYLRLERQREERVRDLRAREWQEMNHLLQSGAPHDMARLEHIRRELDGLVPRDVMRRRCLDDSENDTTEHGRTEGGRTGAGIEGAETA